MRWVFRRWAARASALVGLAVTFVTLLVTDVLADSLTIEGSTAWVVGTLIVWVAWLLTDWIITGARVRRAQRATGPGRV
jgi:hypothetical protein